jgi:ubiquinone/menaquinone biosynthesis C-methylase UbiE/uncharacterized protein YbaR (Trm112 family)
MVARPIWGGIKVLNTNLIEHLICPDCKDKLEESKADNIFLCPKCNRVFSTKKGIINLLPKYLEKNKINEEITWSKGGYFPNKFKIDKLTPWASFSYKHNEIRYFIEKVLPNYHFEGTVLEIGSGMCYGSCIIKKQYPMSTIIASDISYSALEIGIEVCKMIRSNVDFFITCDCERLPFEDNFFDVVFGSSVIHHFTEPEKGMSEIYRVLKENGVYIGFKELASNKLFEAIFKKFGAAGHIEQKYGVIDAVYSFSKWRDILASGGFEDFIIDLERDYEYKLYHWFPPLYYKMLSVIPIFFVRNLFLHGISIYAKK